MLVRSRPRFARFSPALKVVNFKFPETEFKDGGKRVLKYDSASCVNADWWDYDATENDGDEPNYQNRKLPIAHMPWEDTSKTDTGMKCSGLKSKYLEKLKQFNIILGAN